MRTSAPRRISPPPWATRSICKQRGHTRPRRSARANSRYEQVQAEHAFRSVGRLRPDFVIRAKSPTETRWTLVEVKGGPKRQAGQSARDALLDLLAYRRDYEHALANNPVPYGLGIAWGRELDPVVTSDAVLCTPDRLVDALALLIDN